MEFPVVLHMRVTNNQLAFIEEQSKANGVSKSVVIRTMLDKAMKKNARKAAKA